MGFVKGIWGGIALAGLVVSGAYVASKIIRDEDLATFGKKAIDGAGEITKSYLTSEPDKAMVDLMGAASKTAIDVMDYETRR